MRLSKNTEKIKIYRMRKRSRQRLKESLGSEDEMKQLWECIKAYQGYHFRTAKQLVFTYTVNGNELYIDRKRKSVTRSSVGLALKKVYEMNGEVSGPKKLGVFGASYLYPIFIKIGIIRHQGQRPGAHKNS